MRDYKTMEKAELLEIKKRLEGEYEEYKKMNLKLDMSRGKPGADQLELSNDLLSMVTADYYHNNPNAVECRNYGVLTGLDESKQVFADILGVKPENIIICGNSSLNMMFDYITQCLLKGAGGKPWIQQGEIKFLCPCPGYDRHFSICEYYGIKMIPVTMTDEGPDMGEVLELIKDSSVKGMFCVPKYSNPTGITYSKKTVEAIAKMTPAAKDFRIIWDNAYAIHDIADEGDELENIFDLLPKYGNEDMVVEFASTSKITFPGAGVAALAASKNNIEMIKSRLTIQTIGHDKLNQLRHNLFFGGIDGVMRHMQKHKEILAPKFDAVLSELDRSLSGTGIASWTKPKGGYFISLNVLNGTAKRVGEMCKNAGVVLTTVGATYPYGVDPNDSNIRIAPSFPPVDELETATKLLCICVRLAAAEKLLKEKQ